MRAALSKTKKALIAVACVLAAVIVVLAVLGAGVNFAHNYEPWHPDYAQMSDDDLQAILSKNREDFGGDDYRAVFRNTGLTQTALDDIMSGGRIDKYTVQRILRLKTLYFTQIPMVRSSFAPFLCLDYYDEEIPLPSLKPGDVLISTSTHLSFIRFGHAALVADTDGATVKILESAGYGEDGVVKEADIATFAVRPAILVLRLKSDVAESAGITADDIAEYAATLQGLPYDFFVGVFSKKFPDEPVRTHCAHFVWYVFRHFGIDVDSNGGAVVTPQNIAMSDCFDLVQVYGFDPDRLWS